MEKFWTWLVSVGAIQGDASYYTRSTTTEAEYVHAINVAYQNLTGENRVKFFTDLKTAGAWQGDVNYWVGENAEGARTHFSNVVGKFLKGQGGRLSLGPSVEELIALFPWFGEIPGAAELAKSLTLQDASPEQIVAELRQTAPYKERFAGMEARKAKGLPAISEAEYLATERGYFNQFQEFGLNQYLEPTKFREIANTLIGGDVSVQEMNARLDLAWATTIDTAPLVQQAFKEFYGIELNEQALMGYFLDPDEGLREIEDQVITAQIGSEALRFGLNINRARAEILQGTGVTQEMAREGFSDIAAEQPVLRKLAAIHTFTPLAQEELENLFFHNDPTVAARRNRIFGQSLSQFQGSITGRKTQQGGLLELLDREQAF